MPVRFFRPTRVEVDLAALRANMARFRSKLPPGVRVLFVAKANAYGHGAGPCAKALERSADWLGVSSVEEGIQLREHGLRKPILVLGSLYPFESFLAAAAYDLTPTVASLEAARRLAEAGQTAGRRLGCHLKIETGMNRIGVRPEAARRVAEFLAGQRWARLEGVYTHFSCADTDAAFTRSQLARFKGALKDFPARGLVRHAANSAASLRFPASRLDMVRPGLALYGLVPGFEPVLSLKTKVVFIKNVEKGSPVSYGAAFRARRRARIATIPIGYADGLPRARPGRLWVLVGGKRCPVVGHVTMDMSMIDVTEAPGVRVGDDVVLIGRQDGESVSALEAARATGRIPYEATCSIASRVPRVYLHA